VLFDLRRGDEGAAQQALLTAMDCNPHVADCLTSKMKLPTELPDAYSPGNRDEAVLYVANFGEAWLALPKAIGWVIRRVAIEHAFHQRPCSQALTASSRRLDSVILQGSMLKRRPEDRMEPG